VDLKPPDDEATSGRLSGLSLSNPEAGNEFACLHPANKKRTPAS